MENGKPRLLLEHKMNLHPTIKQKEHLHAYSAEMKMEVCPTPQSSIITFEITHFR